MSILNRILLTMAALLLTVYAGLIVIAYWPYADGVPVSELAAPEDKFVIAEGLQLRYQTWGEPGTDSPAIVLIHGFANSALSFEAVGKELSADHYVIALDMPGFGLSAKPADRDYGNESQAQAVVEFITALGLEEFIIGGHSMGGALAIHVAVNSPKAIGLILFNPGIITTGVPPLTEYLVFPMPRLAAKTFAERSFRENFLASSYFNPDVVTEERLDELMLTTRSEGYIEGVTQLMSYYVAGNEIEMLDEIRVPTLIVWGVEDQRKPSDEGPELQSLIAGSRLIMVQKAGHYVHEERPAAAAKAIRDAKEFWAVQR